MVSGNWTSSISFKPPAREVKMYRANSLVRTTISSGASAVNAGRAAVPIVVVMTGVGDVAEATACVPWVAGALGSTTTGLGGSVKYLGTRTPCHKKISPMQTT